MTGQLIICDTGIRQDSEGRYCLNDLHKAAGGEKKHQPALFLRRVETYALEAEIQSTNSQIEPIRTIRGGTAPGTFVAKELVYAYAMWISAAFHLKVIRAYDTLQTQGVAVAEHAASDFLANPLDYFGRLLEQAKEMEQRALKAKATAVEQVAPYRN